jgi:hypothetical protein
VQTNAVTRNGSPGVLIVVRKSGGSSTLAVIDGTNAFCQSCATCCRPA